MDRRRVELQIRAVLVTFRIEQRRRDSPVMEEFRRRADAIMDSLEIQVDGDPDLLVRISDARREIGMAERGEEPSS